MKYIKLVFAIASFIVGTVYAGQTASEIYLSAKQKQQVFSGTWEIPGSNPDTTLTVSQRIEPDGIILKHYKYGNKEFYTITNNQGSFTVYPDEKIAIKSPPLPIYNRDRFATYTMREDKYQGLPCYVITQKVALNEELFQEYLSERQRCKLPMNSDEEMRKEFLEHFNAQVIMWIGKSDLYIYMIQCYDRDGKLLTEEKSANFHPGTDLPDQLFEIPANCRIEIPASIKEMVQGEVNIWTKQAKAEHKNRIKERTSDKGLFVRSIEYADSNFQNISTIASRVLFWSAMILLGLIIFIKCKKK